MRRFSKTILSLLTVVLAVTAWGAAQRAQRAEAPRAVGDLKLESANPASGMVVTEISTIDLKFSMDIAGNGGTIGHVYDADNTAISAIKCNPDEDFDMADYSLVHVKADPEVTAAGQYTVVIDANSFTGWSSPSASNDEIRLTYIIGGGDVTVPLELVSQSPLQMSPVTSLETIELTFNQAVVLGKGDGFWEVTNMDTYQTITTGSAVVKNGDDKTLVITLAKALTESGNYCLVAPMDYVFPAADPESGAAIVPTTYYTVVGNSDVKETLEFTGTRPAQGDYEAEKFHDSSSIAINFAGIDNQAVTVAGNSLTLYKDGQPYKELSFNTMMLDFGAIMLPIDDFVDEMESGVYTMEIPAGFFTCNGKSNEALSFRWNFTKKGNEGPIDPTYELKLKKVQIKNAAGEVLDLMDPNTEVATVGKGDVLTVGTTDDNTVQFLWINVYHFEKNSAGSQEQVIDKTIQIFGYERTFGLPGQYPPQRNDAGEFEADLVGSASELYKGTDYYMEIQASNVDGTGRPDYVCYGTETVQFKGGITPFEYSDVDVVSVWPDPKDSNFEIMSDDFEFMITFTAPVKIVPELTFQNEGQSSTSDFAKITPNGDKTVWTFTPTKSFLNKGNGLFAVGAVDMQGRPVAALGATKIKEKTCMQFEYTNNLDAIEFPVTPGGGKVESIYEFEVITPDGKTLGMTTNNLNRPYLETSTGAFVCYADIEDNKLYYKNGEEVPDTDLEPNVYRIVFHLDKEITAPGIYYMVFPSGSFITGSQFDTSSSRPARYQFIIEGTPEVAGQTVSEGAALSELGMVGFIFNNEVDFAGRNKNIALRKDGSSYLTAPAFITMQDGRYMVCANFTENDAPVKLEAGAEYELRLNNGQLVVPGTEMTFEQISVNFTGAKAAAEYVALTSEVAGHAASVAKVAKGETATVNFTPAEGWKVEAVTFNGADVTAQVNGNSYTTPALEADAALNAVYAYDGNIFEPTGMDEVFGDFQLRAWSENGAMFVAGLQAGMTVDVYTVNGTHVGNYALENDDTLKINAAAGTYVITVAKEGKREAIKLQNK